MSITQLSQRDSRWSKIIVGTGNKTIGEVGCTITAIAMLAGLTPVEVNDRLKAVNGFAKTNLVIWSKINEAIPWLKFVWRGYSYKNSEVLNAINKIGACLVEVDFDNNVRTDGKHWVLFIGNQRQNDPWTGRETYTTKYSLKTGYATIDIVGKPEGENMPDALKECLAQHTVLVTEAGVKDGKIKGQKAKIKKMGEEARVKDKQISAQKGLVTTEQKKAYDFSIELSKAKLRIKESEKPKPVEAIKDPVRYVVSLAIGALLTWAYTNYPFLGQLGADQQAVAAFLIGLVVKGLDKYQHESGSRFKLPF